MSDNDTSPARSLRQRPNKRLSAQPTRRKSIKLEIPEEPSVEDIYRQVNANVNFNPTALETIYESPKGKNLAFRDCMGVVKLKRHCRFTPFYNPGKLKIKLRKNKSKKLKRVNGNLNSSVRISLEDVEKVLKDISEDENEENHIPSVSENKVENNYKYSVSNTHKENQIHEINTSNFDMYDSFMEDKEDKFMSFDVNSGNTMHEQELKELPEFLDNIFSPGKQKRDKLKRNRRRSGRVQPYCSYNDDIDIKTISEESELKPCTEANHENEGCSVPKIVSRAVSPEVSKPKSKHTSTRGINKSKKTRRNSGVNRSLYKTFVNSSFDESCENITESSFNDSNIVIKNIASPTSLMNRLTICSPEPTHLSKPVTKKGRRKSARFSMNKSENEASFGTLWIGTQSPSNDPLPVAKEDSTTVKDTTNFIDECIKSHPILSPKIDNQMHDLSNLESQLILSPKIDNQMHDLSNLESQLILSPKIDNQMHDLSNLESQPILSPKIDNQMHDLSNLESQLILSPKIDNQMHDLSNLESQPILSTKIDNQMHDLSNLESQPILSPKIDNQMHDLSSHESPILSGIFECEARVTKDKSVRRKRGSRLLLDHFLSKS